MESYNILATSSSKGYALLDSGEGEKLERYGDIIVARPDPQALWRKKLLISEWNKADAYFGKEQEMATASKRGPTVAVANLPRPAKAHPSLVRKGGERGGWQTRKKLPERWPIEFGGLKFWIKLSAFKHTGLFPEHASNWDWLRTVIPTSQEESLSQSRNGQRSIVGASLARDDKRPRALNLFGYTGGATLACAQAGAEVVHVDGSKVAIGWGRDNAELSGLKDKPIRWILDDAVKFVKREIKRGNKYDGIIMDPPAFGHGPGGELWKVEDNFLELLDLCKQILSDTPLFFLINGYASGYSAIAYQNSLGDLMKQFGGNIEIGELTIAEERGGRLLPCGIFARWSN